ncbi:S26 family signal peptidase [Dietzia sp. E1]|uniref:S26 family signal peptidase n=1 Tax=Dietzia sp. E1 TaxID=328361 RepID=UPI0015FCCA30|nr:S26 family signal peptidase [Dietzia sp. E1]MBB1020443.1 S26 family signal peptidase [Dietzia sp. E1]
MSELELADPAAPVRPARRGLIGRLGDIGLTVLAALGAVSIAFVVLAVVFDIGILMFRTGSMGPTIPAGSVAIARQIPAAEMSPGDIVTVERGEGELPVTHRVVRIIDSDPVTGAVAFDMRGDANDSDDPGPYAASTVKLVLFSVPGGAPVIQQFSNPVVLAGLTVAASLLVGWSVWTRGDEEGHEEDDEDDDDDNDDHPASGADPADPQNTGRSG